MHIWYINSLFGPIRLEEDDGALVGLAFDADGAPELEALPRKVCETPLLEEAEAQLNEYFAGVRRTFTLPLAARGTPFQRAVWAALCEIPCGETRTYGQIAAAIGKPNATRAVGAACHANPIAILIPCHRVVGASGALTGYAAGVEVKEYLLALEQG
jgi:methylated-DNA-[protein]-cysteine S-methyltransferase